MHTSTFNLQVPVNLLGLQKSHPPPRGTGGLPRLFQDYTEVPNEASALRDSCFLSHIPAPKDLGHVDIPQDNTLVCYPADIMWIWLHKKW